ncbi:MAG: hypothetical protein LAT50_12490, partial [Ectothiorhodospiraceae bacterium]|nr:hypothetical protein [Ectothiorhodospiraceae bacterium]
RIALRFTRDPGLAGSIRDVRAQYPLLEQDFLTFDLLHTPLEQLDQHLHEREDGVSTDPKPR